MKKYPFIPVACFLMTVALLFGCGGSGSRSDDRDTSLSGSEMVLSRNGASALTLQFSGYEADVLEWERQNRYHESYVYQFNAGDSTAVLNVAGDMNKEIRCSMKDVRLSFDDAGKSSGVIVSGIFTEVRPELDPAVMQPKSLAGWTFRMNRG